jgi:selenocysteine-specific elongation factor
LIRVLTGTDPDRLPEEKKRGITIELGYATLDLGEFHLGIVDVPGHEKFVRQMLAGATGMDLAMLVIAADDSIKQQTREHLDILRLLNLRFGVIALTKIDLVEADWLDLVEQEIRELVADTFLAEAPIVRVSSKTGAGVEELKAAIADAASRAARDIPDPADAPFRMAIDRSFAIEGFGAVVTGSVSSGQLRVGDIVELQPSQIEVRVRGLQNHETSAEMVSRGQRAAINLSGIHHADIPRGNELATIGHLKPTTQLAVELLALPNLDKSIKDRSRIRFHIGTAEVAGNLRLPPDQREIEPGQTGHAVLFLNEPIVAAWGQPFVLRLESPVITLGGGRVAFPNHLPGSRPTPTEWMKIQTATSRDHLERASAAAYLGGLTNWQSSDLVRWTGISPIEPVLAELIAKKFVVKIQITKDRAYLVHADRLKEIGDLIVGNLRRLHEENPLRLGHPINELQHRLDFLPEPELFRWALKPLVENKTVVQTASSLALEGMGPKLSRGERLLFEELLEKIRQGQLTPATPRELASEVTKNKESVPQLLKLAVDGGQLVQVNNEWLVHSTVFAETLTKLREEFQSKGTLTVSDIRTLLDISRKFAVPLCEYLDKIHFTVRDGDNRRLAKKPA